MSQEKIETVRRGLVALGTQDFDAVLAVVHPD
jgi:hypothetical protein